MTSIHDARRRARDADIKLIRRARSDLKDISKPHFNNEQRELIIMAQRALNMLVSTFEAGQ